MKGKHIISKIMYHIFVTYPKGGKLLTSLDVPLRAYNAQVENITALVSLVEIRYDSSGWS